MQCHNTDVILAARFSNKLVLPCSQLGKYAGIHKEIPGSSWELQKLARQHDTVESHFPNI